MGKEEIEERMENKILNHIIEIKEDISAIKTDISYHIKRTNLLEDELNKHESNDKIHKKHVSIGDVTKILVPISIILGIIITLQGLGVI